MGSLWRWVHNEGGGSGAANAITAAATEVFNPVWLGVTSCYARVTRLMEVAREHRLAATYHPKVEMAFAAHAEAQADGLRDEECETVAFAVSLTNLADVPLRIESVRTMLVRRQTDSAARTAAVADAHRLVSPHKQVQFDFAIPLPEGMSSADVERRAIVHCCDLSGLSKYSLVISDKKTGVRQFVGFRAA
jgi:hypothetical protein